MNPICEQSILIREANDADIDRMMHIRLAVKENTLSNPGIITRQMCEDYLHRYGRGWVAEIHGVITGFSYADHQDSSIWALFVLPEHEGCSIGKRLLQQAVDYLFALGNTEIHLSTAANTRADRFYSKQGWQRGGMKNAIEVGYVLHAPGTPGSTAIHEPASPPI